MGRICLQCKKHSFDPWVRKILKRKEWQPIHSSILAWRNHGQRSLAGYSPWVHKESDMTEQLPLFLYLFSIGRI